MAAAGAVLSEKVVRNTDVSGKFRGGVIVDQVDRRFVVDVNRDRFANELPWDAFNDMDDP